MASRRYKSQSSDETTVSRQTIQQIGDLAAVLSGVLEDQIPDLIYQLRVQAEALEMNLWVTAALLAKYTDAKSEDLVEEIAEMQQQFLETQDVSRFLGIEGPE